MTGLVELKLLILAQMEQAAIDSGFDIVGGLANSLMAFRSSQSPLRIWLGIIEADASTSQPIIGRSMPNVAAELRRPEITTPVNIDGCHAWITARDFVDLDRVLGRAFALSRALPNQLLVTWQSQVETLSVTERESLVRQPVGQDLFREGLLALWAGRCAITGVDEPALLRASHAKPWKDASDSDRLDAFNGLLLAAHLDAAFDKGLITLDENGVVIPSAKLPDETLAVLGLARIGTKFGTLSRQVPLRPRHQPYMAWRRTHVFEK